MNPLLNLARARDVFGGAGLDAVMATTHANVRYLSGFVGFGQRLMPSTQVYALARVDRMEEPVVVLPAGELDMWAQFPPEHATLSPYGRFFVEVATDGQALSDEIGRYRTLAADDGQESRARGRASVSPCVSGRASVHVSDARARPRRACAALWRRRSHPAGKQALADAPAPLRDCSVGRRGSMLRSGRRRLAAACGRCSTTSVSRAARV